MTNRKDDRCTTNDEKPDLEKYGPNHQDTDGKRVSIEFHEPVSDVDRRECLRMIRHLLDGDAVFAVEGSHPSPEELDEIEAFVEELLEDND